MRLDRVVLWHLRPDKTQSLHQQKVEHTNSQLSAVYAYSPVTTATARLRQTQMPYVRAVQVALRSSHPFSFKLLTAYVSASSDYAPQPYSHALTPAAAEVTWLREIAADVLLVFLQHAELCLQSKPWSFRPQLPTVCSKICIVFSLCSALSCSVAMRYVGAIPVLAIPRCSPAEDEATFGSTSSWCACS